MPINPPILDPNTISLDAPLIADRDAIREWVPQRTDMEMLHGIAYFDADAGTAVAIKEIGADEFWVDGHIPGRPLFPGVLMIESAAQLCCYVFCRTSNDSSFFAFAGVNNVKFRGTVKPGDPMLLMARAKRIRRSLGQFDTQAFVGGNMVFEGEITGMVLPPEP